jgi:hypothetical protein
MWRRSDSRLFQIQGTGCDYSGDEGRRNPRLGRGGTRSALSSNSIGGTASHSSSSTHPGGTSSSSAALCCLSPGSRPSPAPASNALHAIMTPSPATGDSSSTKKGRTRRHALPATTANLPTARRLPQRHGRGPMTRSVWILQQRWELGRGTTTRSPASQSSHDRGRRSPGHVGTSKPRIGTSPRSRSTDGTGGMSGSARSRRGWHRSAGPRPPFPGQSTTPTSTGPGHRFIVADLERRGDVPLSAFALFSPQLSIG